MSYFLYYGCRGAAGVCGRILNLGKNQKPGKVHDDISIILDDEEYDELCQDKSLVLEEIWYCQSELGFVGKSLQASRKLLDPGFDENKQNKSLLNHDFLLLKLRSSIPDISTLYIQAEKFAGTDSTVGIYITIIEGSELREAKQKCLVRIECGTQINLLDLTATLKKMSPDYEVGFNNCWDYARQTTKYLLEECVNLERQRHADHIKRLLEESENLESRIASKHVSNMVKCGKSLVRQISLKFC